MSPVHQSRQGDVLVLTIDNPPVNALGSGVLAGLHAGLDLAESDSSVGAVVLIGAGRTFIAGADIKSFDLPLDQKPDLRGLVLRLDGFAKPTIAALHGTALGGGLEVALGCTYRLALPGTQLGLPEVRLGVLPGAGGTQLLPRAVGIAKALKMMLSGIPVSAEEAASLGLVDEVVTGDLLSGAMAFARAQIQVQMQVDPLPRLSLRNVQPDPEAVAAARQAIRKTHKGQLAPGLIVDLAELSTGPFEAGVEAGVELFMQALDSPQSRGLRRLFFAERAVGKIPGLDKSTPQTEIHSVGIIGAGTMGGGIAMNFLNVGIPVTIVETGQAALDRGLGIIRTNYEGTVRKGRLSQADMDKRLSLLTSTLSMDDLAGADLIIEAVFEDMAVKREIFARLDAIAKPGAILATNTSTLDVNEIAWSTRRPESVIGLHFFSPANVMKLLEIVRGVQTSDTVLATCLSLARRINKVGVVVGVCDGFVGNRMVHRYGHEARKLAEEGAAPEQVDAAMHDLGLPMGPFEMSDMAGLDVGYLIRQHQARAAGAPKPGGWLDRLVEEGRKGQKTGAGIYDYPAGRTPVPSPYTAALLDTFRHEQALVPRTIDADEITRRLIASLVNEGAQILDEGIALRSGDIDVIYVYGYGFPAYRGGPMGYADEQGLKSVVADLERFGSVPAPLLKQLADEGKTFAAWDAERGRG